ncbi:MAG: class I SAM-dependent methyltransferase [Candidatus Aureabacteria bacterium]|nr:class I SAM-dependent methyltransferase [Candidatus Auribacterota bacterium]
MNIIRKILHAFGYDLVPKKIIDEHNFLRRIPYAGEEEKHIMQICRPYTQTTPETMFALIRAVKYIVRNNIPGVFVECGVWKGGSAMAMAMMLDQLKYHREICLFDTFTGMPPGCDLDIDLDGNDEKWYREKSDQYVHAGSGAAWNASSLEEVRSNLAKIGNTLQQFRFIQGRVEETLPEKANSEIALLRLDTDFYSSTKHELIHLFPRLAKGGILIVDDYGHFLGARKAVDEYFRENNIAMFMNRVDYTAIIGVKS